MTFKNFLISMVLGLLIPGQCLIGQEKAKSPSGCSVINKNRPSVFVTFERIDGDSVWLRLFNNMSCGIVARSGDLSSKQYEHLFRSRESKTPAGETLTEYIFVWPAEGVVAVPIVYNLEGKHKQNESNTADHQQFEDHIYTFSIPPERSVKFSVFADHFRRGLDISVPIAYEWEAGFDVEPVKHQAFFFNSQIPKGVIHKLMRSSDENR